MPNNILPHLLATLSVQVHAFAFCEIQSGWRLEKRGISDSLIVHYVLSGAGSVQTHDHAPVDFGPHSIVVVPRGQPHTIGFSGATRTTLAAEGLGYLPDGLLRLSAGDGSHDILLACGVISTRYAGALGLFDRLQDALVEDMSTSSHLRHAFSFMVEELANPGLGTSEVTGALMKQCLVMLLRLHLKERGPASPVFHALGDPRLARAVAAIVDDPAAAHSVESLAILCGMSRTGFAERFSTTFGEGPMTFLHRARLRLGARLLVISPMPVKVIAASVGFSSRSHFSHAFKAAHGLDPTAFRKRAIDEERHAEPPADATYDSPHGGDGT